jgi:hypothetical protein
MRGLRADVRRGQCPRDDEGNGSDDDGDGELSPWSP